jgi:hypothetical protein
VRVTRTADTIVAGSLALMAPGHYIIVDDNARAKIRPSGDEIRVSGTSTAGAIAGTYVFDVPDGCHIHKVSGPDVITAQ